MFKRIKNFWDNNFSIIIPVLSLALYITYVYRVNVGKTEGKLIQESLQFSLLLQNTVTFMSIVLSVFAFLLPSFVTAKSESKMIEFFEKNANMEKFIKEFKNVVLTGLMCVFLSGILFLEDIIPPNIFGILVTIWLGAIIYFLCCSYRYISLLIELLIGKKVDITQKTVNQVTKENVKKLENIEKF